MLDECKELVDEHHEEVPDFGEEKDKQSSGDSQNEKQCNVPYDSCTHDMIKEPMTQEPQIQGNNLEVGSNAISKPKGTEVASMGAEIDDAKKKHSKHHEELFNLPKTVEKLILTSPSNNDQSRKEPINDHRGTPSYEVNDSVGSDEFHDETTENDDVDINSNHDRFVSRNSSYPREPCHANDRAAKTLQEKSAAQSASRKAVFTKDGELPSRAAASLSAEEIRARVAQAYGKRRFRRGVPRKSKSKDPSKREVSATLKQSSRW